MINQRVTFISANWHICYFQPFPRRTLSCTSRRAFYFVCNYRNSANLMCQSAWWCISPISRLILVCHTWLVQPSIKPLKVTSYPLIVTYTWQDWFVALIRRTYSEWVLPRLTSPRKVPVDLADWHSQGECHTIEIAIYISYCLFKELSLWGELI